MKNIINKIIGAVLILSSLVGFSACKNNDSNATGNKYFHIKSSDKDFDTFINEYYLRHVREGEWAVNDLELGYGSLYMKEWEARSLSWMDTKNLSGDRLGKLKYYINDFPIDKYGYMWSTSYSLETAGPVGSGDVHNAFAQGWPIPNYLQSDGKSLGYEFNENAGDLGWTSNGKTSFTSGGLFSSTAYTNDLWYLSPEISLNTEYAPFLAFDLRVVDVENYESVNNIDDVYVSWQTVEGGDEWFEVSQKEYSTIPQTEISSFFGRKMFFPMYINDNWAGKTVKRVKISIKTTDDKPLTLRANLNYVRLDVDTRQSNNNTVFLCYANEYFRFNNDESLMREQLTKFRKMTEFLLEYLDGKSGLLDISYLQGHDGLGLTIGHGIGNGYWDIYAAPRFNIDANVYFYKALLAMAEIEERANLFGVNVDKKDATVVSRDNKSKYVYAETAESLRALAERVKIKIQTTFWNAETERFYYGDVEGRKIDYGYVQFNLEAVTAGVATKEQEEKVMSWINGDRVISGDDSVAEDIYRYVFAPRSTTKKNLYDYSVTWSSPNLPFGEQVQDGGAIGYVSYYDLISRVKVLGIDNSFNRVKKINEWYLDVKSAGGQGAFFYSDYYVMYGITLQGGGTTGAIGLDCEFLENAMVYNYIADAILNLDATTAYTLKISPKLPDALTHIDIYNLYYDGVVYDIRISRKSVEVTNVRGNTKGLKLEISSLNGNKRSGDFKPMKVA